MHNNLITSGNSTTMAEQSQYNISNDFVNITIPEKLQAALRGKPPSRGDSLGRQMQKVPALLRLDNKNEKDYDPLVVSFGPYHHGKPELRQAEDFKLKALQLFVADTGKDLDFYYTKVLELVDEARNCYIEDYSTYGFDDPTFAQMMLLDACFIIHYILSGNSYTHYEFTSLYLGDFISAMILRDLFLLENQIPFWILKLVLFLGYGEDKGEELLDDFLKGTILGEYKRTGKAGPEKQPFHLLDAFWLIIVSECSSTNVNSKLKYSDPKPSSIWMKHIGSVVGRCSHFLRHYCSLGKGKHEVEYSSRKYFHSFRSVTDLKAKGIHFKPSCAGSLKGISFKSGYFSAQLEVPIWFVSIYTKVFFLNMIAYELCPSPSTNRAVTAYIEFMKSLIDIPEDAKELREKKILLTTLGSDDEIAKVYKEIRTYGLDNESIFQNVKEQIQKHCKKKAKTWLAEFLHSYFRSPWTAIALFAATFLLVLTFLQTYFTIKPSSG